MKELQAMDYREASAAAGGGVTTDLAWKDQEETSATCSLSDGQTAADRRNEQGNSRQSVSLTDLRSVADQAGVSPSGAALMVMISCIAQKRRGRPSHHRPWGSSTSGTGQNPQPAGSQEGHLCTPRLAVPPCPTWRRERSGRSDTECHNGSLKLQVTGVQKTLISGCRICDVGPRMPHLRCWASGSLRPPGRINPTGGRRGGHAVPPRMQHLYYAGRATRPANGGFDLAGEIEHPKALIVCKPIGGEHGHRSGWSPGFGGSLRIRFHRTLGG